MPGSSYAGDPGIEFRPRRCANVAVCDGDDPAGEITVTPGDADGLGDGAE